MKNWIIIAGLILGQTAFARVEASGKVFKATPQNGAVVFNAVAVGLKLQGKGEGIDGSVQVGPQVTGAFKFKLDTLDTGIGLRNTHMKEKYLETAKYPYGEIKIESVSGFSLQNSEGQFPFKGSLTLHNISKPISGNVEVKKSGENFKIKALFDTKISDFQIPLPAYAGVVVKDDVKVVVESELM